MPAGGSSPLARGLPRRAAGQRRRRGIIPARAGFTYGRCTTRQTHSGSSPLARGLRLVRPGGLRRRRIIPARAGFTRLECDVVEQEPDHPRSRGVYTGYEEMRSVMRGSSPLARGLPTCFTRPGRTGGIIPARAGFTPERPRPRRAGSDHPRSRGVYVFRAKRYVGTAGSSPLARGLRPKDPVREGRGRIIPARAGFTKMVQAYSGNMRDHPRSRGVYSAAKRPLTSTRGSSPLARGLRRQQDRRRRRSRIIPARAGFTSSRCSRTSPRRDHPRSRGVYLPEAEKFEAWVGSSPLARGLRCV